jgi:hypothetical protein
MFDLNDLDLERPDEASVTPPPRRSANYGLWAGVLVAAIGVAGGVWYYTSQRQRPAPQAVTAPAPAPVAVPKAPEAPLVKAMDIDLPPLAQTDPIVRQLVAKLSSHPTVAAWLATKGLVANFTVATLNISEGRTPLQPLRALAPRGRFRTMSAGEDLYVDARSYERYTPLADAIGALDSVGTASLYLTLKPRITEAYRELGYPEGDFDRVLERALGVLLQTPAVDGKVALYPKGVTYAYSDPKLESLLPVQKQFLRLGPSNGQTVRGTLEEIAALLNLHPADTPTPAR